MIDIYYTSFSKKIPDHLWYKYLNMLPVEMQNKNARYRNWQDRQSHLIGKLLLIIGLSKYGYNSGILTKINYSDYNRPFLNNTIDFNISHSGNFVLCAMAEDVRIGVDIEEIKKIDFKDFGITMDKNQWEEIMNSVEPTKAFFKLWTIKESIIKADGRGLAIPLKDIRIWNKKGMYDRQNWYFEEVDVNENYIAFLATDIECVEINYWNIDFNNQTELHSIV